MRIPRPKNALLLLALAVPIAAEAGPDAVSPEAVSSILDRHRRDWTAENGGPGRAVDWVEHAPKWDTDANGNQRFWCVVAAASAPTDGGPGRMYMARLEVYYDPADDEVKSRVVRADGAEGWDVEERPVDEILEFSPDSPIADGVRDGGAPGAEDPGPADELTKYVGPLTQHNDRLAGLLDDIEGHPAMPEDADEAEQWAARLKAVGRSAVTEVRALGHTLRDFVDPRTRAGLLEEIELAQEDVALAEGIVEAFADVSGVELEPLAADERDVLLDEARKYLRRTLAQKVSRRFHSQGVKDALDSGSFREALDTTVAHIKGKAKQRVEDATYRITGLRFHNARSARAALRSRVRREVKQRVAELLLRVGGNQIIVEILGEPIIRWIEEDLWPRLRELFRPKGNHDGRTETSVGTLARGRGALWELPPDARLDDVRRQVRRAEGALHATRYLVTDLERAGRDDLLDNRLRPAGQDLERAIRITQQRFFLHRVGDLEDLEPDAELVVALADVLQEMVDAVEAPDDLIAQDPDIEDGDPGDDDPADEGPPLVEFAKPIYVYHIFKMLTPNGEQEKDFWQPLDYKPKPEDGNLVLVPDQYGAGVWQCFFDGQGGPFRNNHELARFMAGAEIPYIEVGRLTVRPWPKAE